MLSRYHQHQIVSTSVSSLEGDSPWPADSGARQPPSETVFDFSEVSLGIHKDTTMGTNGSVDIKDEETRNTMMRMIIKFSDIANPAKEYESHKKWSRLVSQEFYMQGDEER